MKLFTLIELMKTKKNDFSVVAIFCLTIGIILSYDYLKFIHLPYLYQAYELHMEIISGEANSPYCYRVLIPWINEIMIRLLDLTFGINRISLFTLSYGVTFLVIFNGIIFSFQRLMHIWFQREYTLIGMLLFGLALGTTFTNHVFQPWSYLELWLFVIAYRFVVINKFWSLVPLVIVASVNRSTGIFIPVLYAIYNFKLTEFKSKDSLKVFLNFIFLMLLSSLALVSLRKFLGEYEHVYTLQQILAINLSLNNLVDFLIAIVVFLGLTWLYVYQGLKRKNIVQLNRLLYSLIPYLFAVASFGLWREVRLLSPLLPVFVMLVLSCVRSIYEQTALED